jgi:outer membrane receptor for ferrienterochelin and colicin
MKTIATFVLLTWGIGNLFSQSTKVATKTPCTLSGYNKDAASAEELLYVNVWVEALQSGATSNNYGFYSLTLPPGTYRITYSYLGYQTLTQTVNLTKDTQLNVELKSDSKTLQEVVVSSEKPDEAVREVSMSRMDVPIAQMKKLPALLGEPDIIKMVQSMPGVTSAGEGTSSFYVRGGAADQNLVLIDEAPVYDVSHLYGLFSVFNADILKGAELYKGGIPAKFGGRLSSLLEVTTKDGNAREFSGGASISTLAAKVNVEGPIVKDKASFILAGRRSYADLIMNQIPDLKGTSVKFYDLNGKINWKINNKNRFFLAAYTGRDVFKLGKDFQMDWGNRTSTLRWNHLFNERMFSNTTLIYSNFDYALESKQGINGFRWEANQREYSLKQDFSWFPSPKLTVQFGYQGTYRKFQPGEIKPNSENTIFKPTTLQPRFALDQALYLSVEQKISERLALQYGLRFSLFQDMGPGTVYRYQNASDNVNYVITDSTKYTSGKAIATFANPEPRFAARYQLNPESSLKFSYNRMVQYIHLISNSTVPIPFNTWEPSSTYLQPQKADQLAIGYFRNFDKNAWEFSAEAYYKKMDHLTAFADNANIFFNANLSTEFRQGKGTSYGLELLLRRNVGDLRGFASYTLSKTEMTIPTVNNDQAFPANYDRRHSFNLSLTYDLSKRWSVGGNFTYATGRPITLPTGQYNYGNYQTNLYSSRNGYRLPAFHRLDLAATYEPGKNKAARWHSTWVFGVYNAYNRKNPFSIYTRVKQDKDGKVIGDGTEKEARMVYLFSALPYVTWNVKF